MRAVMAATAAVVVLAGLAAPSHGHDPEHEAEELEEERDGAAEEVDELDEELAEQREELEELTDEVAQAEAKLAAIEQQLEIAEAELVEAKERYQAARAQHAEAIERLEATEEELEEREEALAAQVAAAHKYGGSTKYLRMVDAAFSEDSASDVAIALRQLAHVADEEHRNLVRLAELHDERVTDEARAEAARETRDEEKEAAQRSRDTVEKLKEEQESVRDDLQDRRDEQIEIVSLIEEDREKADALLAELAERAEEARAEAEEAARAAAAQGSGDIVCPVPSGSFVNDWGFPRSGGRTHKGNDIFADRGDPIYAVADGTVKDVDRTDGWKPGASSGLGGKTISIRTDPSTWWYFAHLDEIDESVQSGGAVEAGQQIGTVGNTGNARHTPPHLHIGFYPGGEADNPYPYIDEACR